MAWWGATAVNSSLKTRQSGKTRPQVSTSTVGLANTVSNTVSPNQTVPISCPYINPRTMPRSFYMNLGPALYPDEVT